MFYAHIWLLIFPIPAICQPSTKHMIHPTHSEGTIYLPLYYPHFFYTMPSCLTLTLKLKICSLHRVIEQRSLFIFFLILNSCHRSSFNVMSTNALSCSIFIFFLHTLYLSHTISPFLPYLLFPSFIIPTAGAAAAAYQQEYRQ